MSPDLRPFKKSNLFSNHYLWKLIKDSPEWREAEPEQAFFKIKELYEKKARVLENYNESQLEENFIRPVLRLLGHWIKFSVFLRNVTDQSILFIFRQTEFILRSVIKR